MRKKIALTRAMSFSNGIIFFSSKYPNYVVMASIDESKKIKAEWLTRKIAEEYMKESNQKKDEAERKTKKRSIEDSTDTLFLLLIPYLAYKILEQSITPITVGICIKFVLIALLLFIIYGLSVVIIFRVIKTDIAKFHGAEHMIANAYSDLHQIPTIEELSRYSRIHTRCSTNIAILLLVACIIALGHIAFGANIYLCIITFLIFILLSRFGKLNFFQNFTTSPPTEVELNVAIAGLTVWLENELKDFENNFSDIS